MPGAPDSIATNGAHRNSERRGPDLPGFPQDAGLSAIHRGDGGLRRCARESQRFTRIRSVGVRVEITEFRLLYTQPHVLYRMASKTPSPIW